MTNPTPEALKEARKVVHYDDQECPHCHENRECYVCSMTVTQIALALDSAYQRGLERAAVEASKHAADYRKVFELNPKLGWYEKDRLLGESAACCLLETEIRALKKKKKGEEK